MKKLIVPVMTTLMVGSVAAAAWAQPKNKLEGVGKLLKVTAPLPEDGGVLVYRPASAIVKNTATEWAYSLFVAKGKAETVIFPMRLGALIIYRVEPRQSCQAGSADCGEVGEGNRAKTLPFSEVPKLGAGETPPVHRRFRFEGGSTGAEYLVVRFGGGAKAGKQGASMVALFTGHGARTRNLSLEIDTRKVSDRLVTANARTVGWLPVGDEAPEKGPRLPRPVPIGPPNPIIPEAAQLKAGDDVTVTKVEDGIAGSLEQAQRNVQR